MKQMIVDYFTKQSGSENIVDHYVWLMDKHLDGLTTKRIVNVLVIQHKLISYKVVELMEALREYIDEMDDAYCGREPEEV